MLDDVQPNTRANLVLAQVGLMELGVDEPVAALREHLLRFYEADCEIQLVTAPGVSAYAPRAEVEHVRLRDLVPGPPRPEHHAHPRAGRRRRPCRRAHAMNDPADTRPRPPSHDPLTVPWYQPRAAAERLLAAWSQGA
jgi:hypothetical protein